jgi:hypothetical protein
MEQTNFEGLSDELLSIDDVDIVQDRENLNDSICLSEDNDE